MTTSPPVEPFGIPDGALGNITRVKSDFVSLPSYYGGISRTLNDSGVRVVAGRLGAGKSLYLRMMRDLQLENHSVYAETPQRNISDLSTEDVVIFTSKYDKDGANSEAWKKLWRRAIFRCAASIVIAEPAVRASVSNELVDDVQSYARLLGNPRHKRRVATEAKQIISEHGRGRTEIRDYLDDTDWPDAESAVLAAVASAQPLFLYVDAIDDNFRWAPAYWMKCQRGLYYAIMDLLREDHAANRIHVVIALRDIVLGSTRTSEHAPRYLEKTHINVLGWSVQSIKEFLTEKVARLDPGYLADPSNPSVASWLSHAEITNGRPTPTKEPIADYLVRHTRIVPRDVVVLGNRLCQYVGAQRSLGGEIVEDAIRKEVAEASRDFASSQLAQCANQVMSDIMPRSAVERDYLQIYLVPNEYQMNDAVETICAAIRTVQNEEFGVEGISTLDDMASDAFSAKVHLAHILWQNGLIAWVGDGYANYYSLENIASTALPRAESYSFNPILFDRIGS